MTRNFEIIDGNKAAAKTAYSLSDVAFVYPITPATPMAEVAEKKATAGAKNIFGQAVTIKEMQSEAGVAAAMHGALASGSLASTFTASQGLLLMVPNIYKMAGEHLPGVIYVAARSIATHALSIFGDHSDIYAARQTGACIFTASNVQEVVDLSPVAHMAALTGKLPVIFAFDGFRTSHETQKVQVWSEEDLKKLMPQDRIQAHRNASLNPNHAKVMGSAQNPDVFFQVREASNLNYLAMPEVVTLQIEKINSMIGTTYAPYEYYGNTSAEHVIVAMGSVVDTIKETVDYMNAQGAKVGVLNVRLFRPFSVSKFLEALPNSVKRISVLDRSKEPGSVGEPLYQDVACALVNQRNIQISRGRYGLASKDTTPEQIKAVFNNNDKIEFTIGIKDDVTKLSLAPSDPLNLDTKANKCCKIYGHASDGTISSVRAAAQIIGEHTQNYCQVYSQHDAKVSGSLTTSHLRFGNEPILEPYFINKAHFVSCAHFDDLEKYKIYEDLLPSGDVLLNCSYASEELEAHLSSKTKKFLAENDIHLYVIDADKIAKKLGLKKHINTVLITASFCVLELMDHDECASLLKKFVEREFKRFGEKVVQMNFDAIDCARENLSEIKIPDSWKNYSTDDDKTDVRKKTGNTFVDTIQTPILENEGDEIPVSAFVPYSDGSTPSDASVTEKLGASNSVAVWNPEKCIQCNHCSFVCPHSAIRPYALTQDEVNNSPVKLKHAKMTGDKKLEFAIGVSVMDCTGCKTCVTKCPEAGKALHLAPLKNQAAEQTAFDYLETLTKKQSVTKLFRETSVKGSQFKKPLLEFPAACAGCGETAYAKLLTQLFGEQMFIANATGCSSIWGNSLPCSAYSTSENGCGPAWSNSLFEDAAEFGYGMLLSHNHMRGGLKDELDELKFKLPKRHPLIASIEKWEETFNSSSENIIATKGLIKELQKLNSNEVEEILENKDYLSKKSQWVFGGDGWAYDIGFGGLDHILASNEDINVLVFDTECYSNTGGQVSKATPLGAIAKLASDGKATQKKNLPALAKQYDNVYVASVSMGADMNQCAKAFVEAEKHAGPSLILAYSPCKHHGLRASSVAQIEEEKAVQCGYRTLFRFNPNSNPQMQIDSNADISQLDDFLSREARFDVENYSTSEKGENLHEKLKHNLEETLKQS